MGVYVNLKCWNCNFSITNGYKKTGTIDNFSTLGPEFINCPKCNSKNLTKKLPYSKMNRFQKAWVVFLLIINSIIFGSLYGGLIFLFFYWLFTKIGLKQDFNSFTRIELSSLIIFLIFVYIFLFSFQKKGIKEYENPN